MQGELKCDCCYEEMNVARSKITLFSILNNGTELNGTTESINIPAILICSAKRDFWQVCMVARVSIFRCFISFWSKVKQKILELIRRACCAYNSSL